MNDLQLFSVNLYAILYGFRLPQTKGKIYGHWTVIQSIQVFRTAVELFRTSETNEANSDYWKFVVNLMWSQRQFSNANTVNLLQHSSASNNQNPQCTCFPNALFTVSLWRYWRWCSFTADISLLVGQLKWFIHFSSRPDAEFPFPSNYVGL